jgi:hypothetical protein
LPIAVPALFVAMDAGAAPSASALNRMGGRICAPRQRSRATPKALRLRPSREGATACRPGRSRQARRPARRLNAGIDAASMARQCQIL